MNKDLNFSQPQEIIDYLTSTKVDYSLLLETANELCQKIEIPHTNLEGQKFHTISQCILEAFKRICGFSSTKWISEKNLTRPLKDGQNFITFTRINAKKEICIYKIANFDQIDFENEFADEIECEKETLPAAEKNSSVPVYTIPENAARYFKTQPDDDKKLKKIINFLRNGDNVFVTGHAGTEKLYFEEIKRKIQEKTDNHKHNRNRGREC